MAQIVTNRGKAVLAATATSWDSSADYELGLLEVTAAAATNAAARDFNFVSELEATTGVDEFTGTNYARQNITSRVITEDDTNDRVIFDSAAVVFANLGVAAGTDGNVVGCFILRNTGGADSTNPLIAVFDLASTVTNGQNLTVDPPTAGWIAG